MTGSGHFKPVASIVFATNGVVTLGQTPHLFNPVTNVPLYRKGCMELVCRRHCTSHRWYWWYWNPIARTLPEDSQSSQAITPGVTIGKAWQDEQRSAGFEFDIAYGDVSESESARQCVEGVVEKHGNIHCLVNNAGITRDSTFRKMTLEQWDQVMHANLRSVFNMTRLVINGMLEEKWGRVINISSVNGQKGQFGQSNMPRRRDAWVYKILAKKSHQRCDCGSQSFIMTAMVLRLPRYLRKAQQSGRLGNQTKLLMQSLSLPQNALPSSQDQTLQSTVVSICSRANA